MTAAALMSRHTSAWQAATGSVDRQLKASVGEQTRETEGAFFWVTTTSEASGTWRCRVRPTGIQLSPVRPHAREPTT